MRSCLQKYAKEAGPYQTRAAEIYDELRNNVINNVYKVRVDLCKALPRLANFADLLFAGVGTDRHRLGAVRLDHRQGSEKVSRSFSTCNVWRLRLLCAQRSFHRLDKFGHAQ